MTSPALSNLLTAIRSGSKLSLDLDLTVKPTEINDQTIPGEVWTSTLLDTTTSGGVAPFTYAWTSDGTDIAILSPTEADTILSYTTPSLYSQSILDTAEWFWTMDEITGTVCADSTTNEDDLQYGTDASDTTPDYSVDSLRNDGTGKAKFIDTLLTRNMFDPASSGSRTIGQLTTSNFTIEIALDWTDEIVGNDAGILAKWGSVVNDKEWIFHTFNNKLFFAIYQSDGTLRNTELIADLGVAGITTASGRHYFSVRMDFTGTELLTLELDGTEIFSLDVSTWSGNWRNLTEEPMTIGAYSQQLLAFPGIMDDASIHLSAISDLQRETNVNWWLTNTVTPVEITENLTCVVTDSAASTAQVIVPVNLNVLGGLDVSISPDEIFVTAAVSTFFTTQIFTATVIGGVGPFTFFWELVDTDGSIFESINSQFSSTTTFTLFNFEESLGLSRFKCTVTDTGNSNMQADDTTNVNINWGNI